MEPDDAVIRVALGGTRESPGGGSAREVLVVTASASEIRARLQPIVEAGFSVEGVTTPGLALLSLARRHRASVPGAVRAYVAVAPFSVACALVRDGVLVLAREMPWGFQGELGTLYQRPPTADDLARRLASELRRSFLFFKQGSREDVSQVLLCGTLPDLRSLTAPLIQLLDVEVETLDSARGHRCGRAAGAGGLVPRARRRASPRLGAVGRSSTAGEPAASPAHSRPGWRAGAGGCWPPASPRPSLRAPRCGARRTARRGRPNVRHNSWPSAYPSSSRA